VNLIYLVCLKGDRSWAYFSKRKEMPGQMMETYKVLGSMLALKEFTKKDLELHSAVNSSTVATAVNRKKAFLDEIGTKETNRRGGQLKVYRVKDDCVELLRSDVRQLFDQVKDIATEQPSDKATSLTPGQAEPPLSLLAGEEVLSYLFPRAATIDQRRELLATATADLETGRSEIRSLSSERLDLRGAMALMQRVRALKTLSSAELDLEVSGSISGDLDFSNTFTELAESIHYLSEHGESARAEELTKRMLTFLGRVLPLVQVPARQRAAASTAAAAAASGLGAHQIAVLPMSSSEPVEEYVQYGVTEGIAGSLSLLPKLTVKKRDIATLKLKELTNVKLIQSLGQAWGVEAVLAGFVEPIGNHLRCTTSLIETGTGRVWRNEYEQSYANIFEMGEGVSRTVSEVLNIQLPEARVGRLRRQPTSKSEAQKLYMEGRYNWSRWTAKGLRRAIDLYEKALELDPLFALAHAGLADCFNMLTYFTGESPRSAFTKAKAEAYEALEFDESLSEAYTSLAYVHGRYYWRWSEAEGEFLRALEINPNYTVARQWFAEHLAAMGRFDEAFRQIELAQDLAPNSPITGVTMGSICYFARKYDLAIKEFAGIVDRNPDCARARFRLGGVYAQVGRYSEAIDNLQRAVELSGGSTRELSMLGYAFSLAGNRDKAEKILASLLRKSQEQYVSLYNVAVIHTALGESDVALDRLRGALEQRDAWLIFLKVDPRLDALRALQRFRDLLAEVGLLG
jgi:tetratricopeptide (TPR) repeat protein